MVEKPYEHMTLKQFTDYFLFSFSLQADQLTEEQIAEFKVFFQLSFPNIQAPDTVNTLTFLSFLFILIFRKHSHFSTRMAMVQLQQKNWEPLWDR